jgi:hypothetical protein
MKNELKITLLSYSGAIINAIKEAKIQNKKIVKIGIPSEIQNKLSELVIGSFNLKQKRQLKTIYGIPVENSKTLQITTEFSQFSNL